MMELWIVEIVVYIWIHDEWENQEEMMILISIETSNEGVLSFLFVRISQMRRDHPGATLIVSHGLIELSLLLHVNPLDLVGGEDRWECGRVLCCRRRRGGLLSLSCLVATCMLWTLCSRGRKAMDLRFETASMPWSANRRTIRSLSILRHGRL